MYEFNWIQTVLFDMKSHMDANVWISSQKNMKV